MSQSYPSGTGGGAQTTDPTQNNLPIGPSWLRQNLAQTDPGGANLIGVPGGMDTINAIGQAYGPSIKLADIYGQSSIDSLARQGLLDQSSLQGQMDFANQSAMFQQAGLGLQQQTLGVQQGALARQMNLLPQQYGIEQQQFGLQGQQIGLQRQEAWQGAQQQQQGLQSQLAASGNPYSVGGGIQRQQIQQGLANQLQGLDINQQQLGLQQQSAGLTYKEQLAQTQDAQKELGIQSQQLGLSGQEITSRLNNALNQLSLQGKVSVEQILQATNQINQGMISPISGLAQAVIGQANLPMFTGNQGQQGG